MLTREQAEYYDALEDLFTMPGWRILIEEATAQIYEYQSDALEQPSWDSVLVLRGKAQQLTELINMEAVTRIQKDMLLEQAELDADV